MNYSSYMHIRHFSPSLKLKVSVILMYCLLLNFALGFAQKESNHLRKGNELYKKEKFSEAELEYRKGLEQKSKSYTGNFNLSNSLYKQQKYKEAAVMLDSLSKTTKDKNQLASVYHNLGNSLLQDKAYAESVEAYKKALKLKPDAEDSRYNLSYAMRKLQQQQQQNQQKQQSKNQDQKQNKDQKPQDKKDQKEEEQRKQNLNREEAEQMLDALNREEKDLRKKTEKKDAKGVPVPSGKDW
jgi:Ca-activated chloride channel family protein